MEKEKMKNKVCMLLFTMAMSLILAACGVQSKEVTDKKSKETNVSVTNEVTADANGENGGSLSDDGELYDGGVSKTEDYGDDGSSNSDADLAGERHYYSKVVITSTARNISDFIYGLNFVLDDYGVDSAYFGYEPTFTITFDTATGKATGGVLKGYVEAYAGEEGRTNYEELYEEAIASSDELSDKIYGFSRKVVEWGDDNYPLVTCISANVDVSEYWVNFEQFISLYFIEFTQDIDGLVERFMDYENNGLNVEHGSNYIINPTGGLKYEWFD